eukprot:TRINITY_DN4667_c0_g1_i2.p1 TRINITY_DN4667_c0_g1~~TRINITY_DN4667_c0_g1_i2.p1  ORF type:complete len:167 (+),score=30.16 TRINITY_DN4667_c0_g1_i2:555-1055(+)
MQNVFALYTTETFGWSVADTGEMFSIFWAYRAVMVGGFIPVFSYFVPPEKWWTAMIVSRIALSCDIAGMVLFGFAKLDVLFFAIGVLTAIGATIVVALRGIFSTSVSKQRQGLMLAAVASLEIIETIGGGPLFEAIYSASIKSIASLTFWVAAGMSALALVLTIFL